jgi:signal transduction histidine kinase
MFLSTSNICCRWDIPDELPDLPISSETRHNLFLVLKEALNNIVKHSRATEVTVRFALRDNALAFSIQDNGKGFSTETNSGFGVGISSMSKRVRQMGGNFDLSSSPGQGTLIKIEIDLNVTRRSGTAK